MLSTVAFLAMAAFCIPFSYLVSYFLDKKRLRRFPFPSVAGFTSLWSWFQNYKMKRFVAIHKAHKSLGPIVRVEPNHLSFSSPNAFYDIYSHAATNILKDEYYDAIAGPHRSSGNTRSREEHTRKRRVIASSFSPKGVAEYEPCILRATQSFINCLDKITQQKGTGSFNITPYIHMYTFDTIGDILFGNTFHFLENGSDECTAETPEGKQYVAKAIPSFLDGVRYSTNLGYFGTGLAKFLKKNILWSSHGAKMGANFSNMSIYRIRRRQEVPPEEVPNDIWSHVMAANSKPDGYKMPFGELVAEANSLVNAGNDTIGSALTSLVFHLAANPDVQRKLQDEIDALIPAGTEVCDHETVKDAPYLRACIDESLRERPPVGIGLPRRTPPEGATIDGHFIPGNTAVSVPTWTVHHDQEIFPEPFRYKPDRWFDEKELPNLRKFCLPFSTGGRACVGRNLAYFQLNIAVATLFWRYNIELDDPSFQLDTLEWFNASPGELPIKLSLRNV